MFDMLFKMDYPTNEFWLLYKTCFFVSFFYYTSGLSSFFNSNDKNYSFVRRFSLSKEQSLSSRTLLLGDILNLSDRQYGREFIFFISSFSFLHSQGVIPVKSSQKMTPNEKISLEGEQMFLTRDSMGIQRGVPTLYLVLIQPSEQMAKPKSAIFQFFRLFKIFAGLRSRCKIPFVTMYLTPSKIQLITQIAKPSCNFPRLVRQESRSPPEQYSVIIKQCEGVLQTSKHLITLGWSRFFKMSIQLSNIFKLDSLYFFSSITFTAHYELSFAERPLQTLLLQPEPISRITSQKYDPIFLYDSQRRMELLDWSLLVDPAHFNLPLLLVGLLCRLAEQ